MVMHARKPQRISDGYFEKHQAHPYQKYKERRAPNEYVGEGRYSPLRSPNGNVPAHGHHTGHSGHHPGHHHYSHCPEERGYPSRNTYVQKGFDKERDRDYKSSREKYTDVRSPKEKRSKECERERSNHERIDTDKKSRTSGLNVSVSRSNKYDKRSAASTSANTGQAGSEWSEHISSSGKKYYYNCISEVSQWEKPREFDSRRTSSKDSTYSSRSNDAKQLGQMTLLRKGDKGVPLAVIERARVFPHYVKSRPSCLALSIQDHDKRSNSRSGRESEKPSKRTNSGSDRYWNSNTGRDEDGSERTRPKHTAHEDGQSLQDMDISPDRSTPLSEGSYRGREAGGGGGGGGGAGAGAGPSSTRHGNAETGVPPVIVLDNSNLTSGSLLAAALPRLVAAANPVPCGGGGGGGGGAANNGGASPAADSAGSGTPRRDQGPPTPTHSENTDPHAPPLHLDAALPRKSIMECLGSYSSVVGSALHAAAPMMTPSLVHYVRADLTAHVAGWPADLLEKQANKLTEEAYGLGCLQCTRVTAELKCTRSVVRHKEIQATLQEQKIMYLRQQISRLEELKSQNSFMSED